MLWLGTAVGLPPVARPVAAAGIEQRDFYYVEEVPADAPVRARFTAPHVTYVASYQGCGCGFEAGRLVWQGVETFAEADVIAAAMTTDERDELRLTRLSLARLRELVLCARDAGEVELFTCWDGEEAEPPVDVRTLDPDVLVTRLAPLDERVKYVLR